MPFNILGAIASHIAFCCAFVLTDDIGRISPTYIPIRRNQNSLGPGILLTSLRLYILFSYWDIVCPTIPTLLPTSSNSYIIPKGKKPNTCCSRSKLEVTF